MNFFIHLICMARSAKALFLKKKYDLKKKKFFFKMIGIDETINLKIKDWPYEPSMGALRCQSKNL
jgi:hypothetical protein